MKKMIDLQGVIVWKKPYSGGYVYGNDFAEDTLLKKCGRVKTLPSSRNRLAKRFLRGE
jgi:hypothetical protein